MSGRGYGRESRDDDRGYNRGGGYSRGSDSSRSGGYRGGRSDYGGRGGGRGDSSSGRGDYQSRGGSGRGDGGRGGPRDYGRDDGYSRGSSRGGGGSRGRGDFSNDNAVIEKLDSNNMFETLDDSFLSPTDNSSIPECGDKFGNYGKAVSLSSNYFRVKSLPNCTIYQYFVSFDPDVPSRRLKQGILRSQKTIIRSVCAFDGSILYLPYKIDDQTIKVTTTQGTDVTMVIKFTNTVEVGSPTSISIINIIIRRVMSLLEMKQIKRHHFNPKDAKTIESAGLEVWPGISGSLNFINNIPLYCVDVAHHVMRRESAYSFMGKAIKGGESQMSREELEHQVVGQVVMTRYNNKTYRIDSIDWSKNPSFEFDLKDGKKTTYMEYYKTHYSIDILDKAQPLLVSTMKERRAKHEDKTAQQKGETRPATENIVHLIPELCFLTGISEEIRSNFHTMKELSKYTRVGPTGRCNAVHGFLKQIDKSTEASEYLSNWGFQFDRQLIAIPARQFPPDKVIFDNPNNGFEYNEKDADWTPALRNSKLYVPLSMKSWILYVTKRDADTANGFLDTFLQACHGLNFRVSDPEMIVLPNANAAEFVREVRKISAQKYNLAMFIIPPNRKEIYDAIKTACCIENPLPTQVILTKTLQRQNALRSVASKVVIQICAKLGGEPWYVNIPSKNKMIVGLDVCHDTASTRNSWLGFVASLNDTFTRYYSRATRQPARTEIADSLFFNMKSALECYYKINKRMPDSVIVFRDGVGDGQIDVVKLHELPSIKNCLMETCKQFGEVPTLCYMIVRKRIGTRLFTVEPTMANNPVPGSIVDRVITKEEYPNFYLVSQSVREGTVNPTHYIIIHNNTRLSTNNIQRLSYKACHLYFNWTGTIRVPAPCQYAHKLCFLIGQSLKKEPNPALSDKLFYL